MSDTTKQHATRAVAGIHTRVDDGAPVGLLLLLLAVAAALLAAPSLGYSTGDNVQQPQQVQAGWARPAVRNCSISGYCSLGRTRPFGGDIHTPRVGANTRVTPVEAA